MNTNINMKEIENITETILFVSGEPVYFSEFSRILNINEEQIKNIIADFAEKYNAREMALNVVILQDAAQMVTKPEYIEYIKAYKKSDMRQKKLLSRAALEILSIAAYNQPVTKNYIEQVRGVDSSYTVNMLVEKDFLEEKGRLDAPGKPVLYGTTLKFLRCFGLNSLDELPDRENFRSVSQELIMSDESGNNN